MIKKTNLLYSGKAKTVFETNKLDHLILEFRDDVSAFNGIKISKLEKKGKINNAVNALLMQKLMALGINTHFISVLSDNESLVKKLEMIPLECVVRNVIAGSLAKRFGLEEGQTLESPIFEFYLKNDSLNDPLINESHIRSFNFANNDEVEQLKKISLRVNQILSQHFSQADLILVDFKLEFGRNEGLLYIGDEITPDGCRIWDANTREKLDKDRFRRDLGNVIESYEIVQQRLLTV